MTRRNNEAKLCIDSSCFLCFPSSDLLVKVTENVQIIAGIGPLVDNYCLVASVNHERSLADLQTNNPLLVKQIEKIRVEISTTFGHTILTEHGRVPVCIDDTDGHEAHCFHAHALMFPLSNSILSEVDKIFPNISMFSSLPDALCHAATLEHYFLVSEALDSYAVAEAPGNIPRQLARTLVAYANGVLEKADWRTVPDLDATYENARRLRAKLRG